MLSLDIDITLLFLVTCDKRYNWLVSPSALAAVIATELAAKHASGDNFKGNEPPEVNLVTQH